LASLAVRYEKTSYGRYLQRLLDESGSSRDAQ
jgi:hypothetical protein